MQSQIRLDVFTGLSVVQKCNPDAVLVGHENTVRRIKKGMVNLVNMLNSYVRIKMQGTSSSLSDTKFEAIVTCFYSDC